MPTHRSSPSAIARILELAALDSDKFEVIIQDTSGDPTKRAMLETVQPNSLSLHFVENAGIFSNAQRALQRATEDFVFIAADDDWIFIKAMQQLHAVVAQIAEDQSIVGVTGGYIIEYASANRTFHYDDLNAPQGANRVLGFLRANTSNVLYYSVIRREILSFCYGLIERIPFKLSFDDQLLVALILAHGKMEQIPSLIYAYDNGVWDTLEGSVAKDQSIYHQAGLPAALDPLHWLLCGLEGALLLNSRPMADRGVVGAAAIGSLWMSAMYQRFRAARPSPFVDDALSREVHVLRTKWLAQSEIATSELLLDICNAVELKDPDASSRYFQFWSTI